MPKTVTLVALSVLLGACGGPQEGVGDAELPPPYDAGPPGRVDGGPPAPDASWGDIDAGPSQDAGPQDLDAGPVDLDAGPTPPAPDAGPWGDAGPYCVGNDTGAGCGPWPAWDAQLGRLVIVQGSCCAGFCEQALGGASSSCKTCADPGDNCGTDADCCDGRRCLGTTPGTWSCQ